MWLIIDVAMNESSEDGVENVERESECEERERESGRKGGEYRSSERALNS